MRLSPLITFMFVAGCQPPDPNSPFEQCQGFCIDACQNLDEHCGQRDADCVGDCFDAANCGSPELVVVDEARLAECRSAVTSSDECLAVPNLPEVCEGVFDSSGQSSGPDDPG